MMAAILFVFDKSSSMSWGLDGNDQAPYGNRRIDFAKAALMDQLNRLSDRVPMGLILFPYLEPCDTTVAVTISRGHKGGIQSVISGVDARHEASIAGGGTPLAEAINLAGQVAEHYGGGVKVVVLTDGEETCGGDPVAVAQ
jgi:Ca-activated chloride channel family protein